MHRHFQSFKNVIVTRCNIFQGSRWRATIFSWIFHNFTSTVKVQRMKQSNDTNILHTKSNEFPFVSLLGLRYKYMYS